LFLTGEQNALAFYSTFSDKTTVHGTTYLTQLNPVARNNRGEEKHDNLNLSSDKVSYE